MRRTSSGVIENTELQNSTETNRKGLNFLNLQNTKDDIEKMMDRITTEIRNIDIEKGTCKAKSPDMFLTTRRNCDDTLAKSILKKTQEKKSKMMEQAISGSFKPKSSLRKTISPKVLLRSNTLIDYQV